LNSSASYIWVEIVKTDTPGILALIAGNGDYDPLIVKALKYNWKEYLDFLSLTGLFIVCIITINTLHMYLDLVLKKIVLKITDSETIKRWKDGNILNCYVSLKLFGWWYKEDNNVYMYFDDKAHLTDAKKWLKDKYPDSIQ
ncbi:1466_t:CDS:2, partial [Diversispora eburnea]